MDTIIRKEFDESSNDNIIFVTEQCNNHCLMCCQPPKICDDIDELFRLNVQRIKTTPKGIKHLGITGGEPSLLGEKLVQLIHLIREELPETLVHILTNGRRFSDAEYASLVATAGDGILSFGVPLHSDYEKDHNMIAGNKHAYEETMYGLYNLAMNGATIEIRIVINSKNYKRLPEISQFILKNLSFVCWVSFMGMERTGYADTCANSIWIEPESYIPYLIDACNILLMAGYDVRIYNIPLCLLPPNAHNLAYQSISEWKKIFLPICNDCIKKEGCCGHFSTSSKPFSGIKPILSQE